MARQKRPQPPCWAWMLAGLLCGASSPRAQSQEADASAPSAAPTYARSMQEDAELTDVSFVDSQRGWAVGDRGVVWHTADGGKHWRLQNSGVNCRLESVHFIDPENGWVAGGTFHPYTQASQGVLLRTRDAGRTWVQDKNLLLPRLRRVQFFNGALGWAIGETSAMFPSGAFVTENGGRTWSPLSGVFAQGWLAGDLVDPHSGALAGRAGMVAAVRRQGLQEARSPAFGLRGLHRMKLAAPVSGWLVGDGGLVLTTSDLGLSWQTPAGDPVDEAGRDFDWRGLEVRGQRVWIAGSPGTKVLHSEDGGQSWQLHSTGQYLPLRAISFVDNLHGWAVGALGTVLATDDGGRSWRRQRAGGTRAALLAVYSEASATPLELLVRLAGNEGYLTAVELLNRRDAEPGQQRFATAPDRAREALVGVGVSAAEMAWAFPLRQAGLSLSAEQLVEGWNRANDGAGLERLEAHLVQQIRTWRPDVMLTHATSLGGQDPLGHVVNQIVLRVVEQAADATRFPEQISQMGLDPWQAKKVFGSLTGRELGTLNITTSQLAGRLGTSLADYAIASRGLIADEFETPPVTLGFRSYIDRLPQGLGEHDFFSGITLHPGGEARRVLIEHPAQGLDAMKRIAQKQRNMQAILSRPELSRQDQGRFLAQIGELTAGLDDSSAAGVIHQLGRQFYRTGRWEMAAETFQTLVDRYPNHPLSQAALVWLVQYWSSGEAARRSELLKNERADQAAATAQQINGGGFGPPPLGQAADPLVPPSNLTVRQATVAAVDLSAEANRPTRAAGLGKLLEQRNPAVYAELPVRFPLASAWRNQGFPRQSERFYLDLVRTRPHDAWWTCAAGEQWLAEPQSLPPKTILYAATGAKPRLDGKLDDDLWTRGKPVELRSALGDGADWPAVALVAYDREFLYLGVHCRRAPGAGYEPASGPRPRDPDLSAHDRVDFLIDLDRDWTTCYRFTIDHRGWTGEACWGDSSWNPSWFVAADSNDDGWSAEAAIPAAALTGEAPGPRSVWALGIQRTVPGVGFQSWTVPAAAAPVPEGFGYLIFE
ncbi:MAG TPA: YCF48-related protein [Pirellulales bacterium]|nr:YCF48-related protein [Pirellulales bacterium]